MKAHTTAADIGVNISEADRVGNDMADTITKEALCRFPSDPQALARFAKAERAVTAWSKWIGILGTLEIEDDCERPHKERHLETSRRQARAHD